MRARRSRCDGSALFQPRKANLRHRGSSGGGVRRFVADSAGEVAKVAMAAQGSEVLIPIGRSGGGLARGFSANSRNS